MQTNLLYCCIHLVCEEKEYLRRCFYSHTDLVQNAVVHNFSRQIAFIQYSGPSKHAWTFFAKPFKKCPKSPIRPAGSNFRQALNLQRNLKELRFNMIKNLLCLFFYWWLYNKKAFDTLGILSTPASDVHERPKKNGKAMEIVLLRLLTINKKI